jgi:hypothetical protein
MTIIFGIIAFWAALSFLIAVCAFFSKGDNKFRQYDWKTSAAFGVYFFIAPVFIPYIRYEDKKIKSKQSLENKLKLK